ncbi:MAG: thiamine-phosphate kinase [Nitrosomonadaceae bacterium]
MLSEFDIIQRYFTRPSPGAVLGVGDDAALVRPSAEMELAISTDMLVSGQHFAGDADPRQLGYKSLAVNLSDMAAMGATPRWAMLAVALPESLVNAGSRWLEMFAEGFFGLASEHRVGLIGGDTTRGPLNICVTIIGEVTIGRALRRSGAKAGDDVWISGQLGDAALVIAHTRQQIILDPEEVSCCLPALNTPVARIALGKRLIGLAHSAIDISDGLLADLGHILEQSKVSATIEMSAIKCSAVMQRHLPHPTAISCLMAGGDDYELCFTVPIARRGDVESLSREVGIPLTRIGSINQGGGLFVLDEFGKSVEMAIRGYDHFQT